MTYAMPFQKSVKTVLRVAASPAARKTGGYYEIPDKQGNVPVNVRGSLFDWDCAGG